MKTLNQMNLDIEQNSDSIYYFANKQFKLEKKVKDLTLALFILAIGLGTSLTYQTIQFTRRDNDQVEQISTLKRELFYQDADLTETIKELNELTCEVNEKLQLGYTCQAYDDAD